MRPAQRNRSPKGTNNVMVAVPSEVRVGWRRNNPRCPWWGVFGDAGLSPVAFHKDPPLPPTHTHFSLLRPIDSMAGESGLPCPAISREWWGEPMGGGRDLQ